MFVESGISRATVLRQMSPKSIGPKVDRNSMEKILFLDGSRQFYNRYRWPGAL